MAVQRKCDVSSLPLAVTAELGLKYVLSSLYMSHVYEA